ncbi:MAG: hypothetical protein ACKV19_04000 [Verrucomicrobiales bacterium]
MPAATEMMTSVASATHSKAGSQPHMIARAGPTIGPVPAIDVK